MYITLESRDFAPSFLALEEVVDRLGAIYPRSICGWLPSYLMAVDSTINMASFLFVLTAIAAMEVAAHAFSQCRGWHHILQNYHEILHPPPGILLYLRFYFSFYLFRILSINK